VMGTGSSGACCSHGLGVFIIPANYTFIEGLGRRRRAKASQPVVVLPGGSGGLCGTSVSGSNDNLIPHWWRWCYQGSCSKITRSQWQCAKAGVSY